MTARNAGQRLAEIVESAIEGAAMGDEYWWDIAPMVGTDAGGVVLAYKVVIGVRNPTLTGRPILATFKQPIHSAQIVNPAGEALIRTAVQAALPQLQAKFRELREQLARPKQATRIPQAGMNLGQLGQQPPAPN